ncbi:MAG TPA: enoyl-CoA hydratase family protein [Alphaproteobacteria bacterium]|nr:enoyl-CoA hydratase family protein [Alphaproteobacteria bacterium]
MAGERQVKSEPSTAVWQAKHFSLHVEGKVVTVTLDRPERKNPLTFESYAELRDFFRHLVGEGSVKAVILTGAGGNFSSGGDVHDIIGPLVGMAMPDLLKFTRMTGDLVKAIRGCPQPVIAAIDGVCAGAGACLAMASDLRIGTPRSKVAFLFARVGLAGCDMGACAILPRIIGLGRAAELLFTGRSMSAEEAAAWGFYNRIAAPDALVAEASSLALSLAEGPTFAHAMTKRMLDQEMTMGIAEAIEQEAQAQAICMQSGDFRRAYEAFVKKTKPAFEGS